MGRGVGAFGCYDGLLNANAAGTAAYGQTYAGVAGQYFYVGTTPAGADQTEIFLDDPLNIRGAMRDALGSDAVEAALAANLPYMQGLLRSWERLVLVSRWLAIDPAGNFI